MGRTIVSICLTVYFTFAQGFLHFSAGLGTSLSLLIILCTLYGIQVRKSGFIKETALEVALVGFLISSLALRSNPLGTVTSGVTILLFFVHLGMSNAGSNEATGAEILFVNLGRYLRSFILRFFEALKSPFHIHYLRPSNAGALSLIVSGPFLVLFHYLFSRVNPSYGEFITSIIRTILSVNVFIYTFQILIQFAFLQALFSTEVSEAPTCTSPLLRYKPVSMALIPLCAMFALFSLFQSTAIAQLELSSEFQILSHYVQRGFWELVWIGMIGSVCWLAVFLRGDNISQWLTTSRITGIFAALCILIGLFTLHKVGLLQTLFGLKDHRIYATALTLDLIILLSGACALSFKVTTFRRVFTACRMCTLTLVTILVVLNVDSLCSSVNPIRFRINGVEKKDYSYLLGNSFDNTAAWESLMTEAISEGIRVPEGYYWGNYRPLCLYYPSTERVDFVIKTHFDSLIEKYSTPTNSLLDYIDFNIAEYRAYNWLLSHSDLLERFYERARNDCSIAAKYYSHSFSNFSINGY